MSLLLKGAELGVEAAQLKLAYIFCSSGNAKDRSLGLFWAAAAADDFHANGFGFLGNELTRNDVPQNRFIEGVQYLKMGHDLGDKYASYCLGHLLLGFKLHITEQKARYKYYETAAKLGVIEAKHNLGLMLYHGDGIAEDIELGEKLLEEAKIHPTDEKSSPENLLSN